MKEKEVKTFFNKDNKLNKGYPKIKNPRESDSNHYRKKFEHILPPIEVLNEYENIYPGTLNRLIEMAEKEQHHRHAIELVGVENYNRAVKIGKNGLVATIMIICITTFLLTLFDNNGNIPILFALISCLTVCMISLLAHLRFNNRRNFNNKNYKNFSNTAKT